jgi:hypothetical protein
LMFLFFNCRLKLFWMENLPIVFLEGGQPVTYCVVEGMK